MIVCLDFASLYPSMMIAGNIFSPAKLKEGEEYWQGNGIYSSIYQNTHEGIKGKYSRKQGIIEKTLFELYKKGLISYEDALTKSTMPDELMNMMQRASIGKG